MSPSEIAVQLFLGVVVADLASGIIHWFEDTYGDPEWPIVGPSVIEPNIAHHTDPLRFTRAPFWKRSRGVFGVLLIVGALLALCGALNVMTVTALLVGSLANETHRWAHLKTGDLPRLVYILQRGKLLQTAQHHGAHHRNGFNTHYCTITNMLNPTLDGLRIFRLVEGVVEGLFGIRPRTDRADYTHPLLGRRWIDRARRVACAVGYSLRRWLLGRGGFSIV